jgi:hypothetical protein
MRHEHLGARDPIKRRRAIDRPLLIALAATVGVVGCNSGDAGAPDPATLTATVGDPVEADFGITPLVSDDGRVVFTDSGCLIALDLPDDDTLPAERELSAGRERCTNPASRLRAQNGAFSPDGTSVSITRDFFLTLDEPDIAVLDTGTASSSVLTDDGVDDFDFDDADAGDLDVMPVFTDDDTIAFLRLEPGSTRSELVTIALDGEERSTEIANVGIRSIASTRAVAVGGDFVLVTRDEDDGSTAVTAVAPDGASVRRELDGDGLDVRLGNTSADRSRLLLIAVQTRRADEPVTAYVLDEDELTPIEDLDTSVAALDPTGDLVAAVVLDGETRLVVHDLRTDETTDLAVLENKDAYTWAAWPEPDLILLFGPDGVTPVYLAGT